MDGMRLDMCRNLNIWDALDKSGNDEAECSRNVASGRRDRGAIRSLVSSRNLQLEYGRVLQE